jgi:hypothetical protein
MLLAAAAVAQTGPPLGPVDGHDLAATDIERVAVGTPAPDFTLARFGGGTITLSQYRGSKNVVLVFYRGYWCRYCITQLSELRSLLDSELKRETELIVISIDGENETRRTISNISKDGVQPDFHVPVRSRARRNRPLWHPESRWEPAWDSTPRDLRHRQTGHRTLARCPDRLQGPADEQGNSDGGEGGERRLLSGDIPDARVARA